MVNVAASLMSWGPFRKEFARWGRQAELFHPEDYPEYSKFEYFAIPTGSFGTLSSNDPVRSGR